jgi:hypothetical protein
VTTKTATFTRPANTTAYTAGDVIGRADGATAANAGSALFAFSGLDSQQTGEILITSATLRIDATAIPSGMTTIVVHLFAGPPDAALDNAAWAKTSTNDKTRYRGSITFTPAVVGGDLWAAMDGLNLHRFLGQNDLFVELVTTGGFTPASGTLFELSISAISANP